MCLSTIIARPGPELTVKSRQTRSRFLKRLTENLARALDRAGVSVSMQLYYGRYIIETPEPHRALEAVSRVFGMGTYSLVRCLASADLDDIVSVAECSFGSLVAGRTFAVRAKRQGIHPYTSMDLERRVGQGLAAYGKVDLTKPQITVMIETLGDRSYLFADRLRGAGGLPGGVQGRALALMSGGIDSAVAAWRMMRRGLVVNFVLCNLAGKVQERQVLQLCKTLADEWAHDGVRLFVLDFTAVTEQMRTRVRPQYWQVVLKRLMLRAAERLVDEHRVEALITGDAIGQVSSQTMANLRVIDGVTRLPILRPLAGYDKQEIIDEAKRIGTYQLSEHVKEYCAFSVDHPVTCGKRRRIEEEEALLDEELIERAVLERKQIDLDEVTAQDLCWPYVLLETIPEGAAVIDCQPPELYEDWHVPGATNHNPLRLASSFRQLPKDRRYFLYCGRGTVAPYLAEQMQEAGYEAYSFRGRLGDLKRQVQQDGPTQGKSSVHLD